MLLLVTKEMAVFDTYYKIGCHSREVFFASSLLGLMSLINGILTDMLKDETSLCRYLGTIEVAPIWDEEFKMYGYGSKAIDKALEQSGINPYGELPCLSDDCKEFKNAKEFAEFLKEKIDKYKSTDSENELEKYIESLKDNCHSFEFVDCSIKDRQFKGDDEIKVFLKNMIDKYVR